KGGRAMLIMRKVQTLGPVYRQQPAMAAFEAEDFDGRFAFELDTSHTDAEIEAAIRSVGDVERVTISGQDEAHLTPAESAAAGGAAGAASRSKHIRVDLRRLDSLMDLIGELVTARGRLNELAEKTRDP